MDKPESKFSRVVGSHLLLLLLLAILSVNLFGLLWLGFPILLLAAVVNAFGAYNAHEPVMLHVLSALLTLLIGLGTCGIMGDIHGRPIF